MGRIKWGGLFIETAKTYVPCHSRCGTIKIPPCLNAMSTELGTRYSRGDLMTRYSRGDLMTRYSRGDLMTRYSRGDLMTRYSRGDLMTSPTSNSSRKICINDVLTMGAVQE